MTDNVDTTDKTPDNALVDTEFVGAPTEVATSSVASPAFRVNQRVLFRGGSGTVKAVKGFQVMVEDDEGGKIRPMSALRLKAAPEEAEPEEAEREKVPVYSIAEAATYLGYTHAQALKHHIYETKRLVTDGMIGEVHFFYQTTLNQFRDEGLARKAGVAKTDPATIENPVYDTGAARVYLGLAEDQFTFRVWRKRELVPDGAVSGRHYFYESSLDRYKAQFATDGWTRNQIKKETGKSYFWVSYHRQKGRLHPIGQHGRSLIFDPADIQRLIAEYGDEGEEGEEEK